MSSTTGKYTIYHALIASLDRKEGRNKERSFDFWRSPIDVGNRLHPRPDHPAWEHKSASEHAVAAFVNEASGARPAICFSAGSFYMSLEQVGCGRKTHGGPFPSFSWLCA